ncbi:MAG TPA: metallophosphoesterase family protein, partial [Candidatus Ozemobacteraceae bacterium]|nr:metallophosphoesterase family protein [Candidatus Ozemobacteraceae bacterium]
MSEASLIVVAVAVLVMVCPLLGAEIQCVALLSDLEGNRERFDHFLAHHRAFYLGDDRRWHLRSDAYFVFGGDAPDRFPGERHVLRELLRLKAESPDRVILIAGNRDVNKLRLPLELSDVAMKTSPRKGKREYHVWCDEQKRVDSKATRLRWMLAKTMGSPDAFELRRNELACETAVDQCAVSDQAVVDSYLEDACPGGLFHRYLKAACLMHRQGQTLYVHAGMPQASLGHVPGERHRVARLDEWMKRLNEWYQEQLHTWETAYSSWDGSAPRPADALIAYAERWGQQPMNPFSVLYGRSTDVEGKVD